MKKAVFGFVYFIAFYFIGCMIAGGIAGGKLGASGKYANNPAALQKAAGEAGQKAVADNLGLIVGVALTLAIGGAAVGVLPGTGSNRPRTTEELLAEARLGMDNRYTPAT
jgi:hypothetical protein